MRTLSYRLMTADDLPAVLHNERCGYSHPWSEANIADSLAGSGQNWVALVDETIVGHAFGSVIVDEGHVLNLCVAHSWQRQGVGRQLLNHLHRQLGQEGAKRIFLEVRESNVPARRLYESFGYQPVGIRKGYYPKAGGRENALVLSFDLDLDGQVGAGVL